MTKSNIRGGFQGSGLVLYNLEYIITQLKVYIRTLSCLLIIISLPTPQKPKTLNNTKEVQTQTFYLYNKIIQYQDSSLITILQGLDQLTKNTSYIITKLVFLYTENTMLYIANNQLSYCRYTKKTHLQKKGLFIL